MTAILANELSKRHDVTVISINNEKKCSYFPLESAVKQQFYNRFKFKKTALLGGIIRKIEMVHPFVLPSSFAKLAYFPEYICKDLGSELAADKFDCIIGVTGHCAILLASMRPYLLNAKLIGWMHNSYQIHYDEKGKGFYSQIKYVKKVYHDLNQIITLTRADAELYRKKMGIDCTYIYNPIGFCSEDKSTVERNKLLYVGRLDIQHKGLDFLVEIMRKLVYDRKCTEWILQIVGDGPGKGELVQWIANANLENYVEMVGEQEHVEKYYKDASIFLCTSKWEGFGLVVVEAMECGLPVISFKTDGPLEIISHGENGYLVDNYNLDEFVNRIECLTKDVELRKQFSCKAVKRAADFALDTIVEQWEEVITNG